MSGSTVLTVPEVAELLGVSRWSIYERIKLGEIPVVGRPGEAYPALVVRRAAHRDNAAGQ